jgi:AcrR family transcriptional regulator
VTDVSPRVLRSDAERNRRLVLEAAALAFAEEGLEVGMAEIARRAGVGNATVFRRFPTKDALVEAILDEKIAELIEAAERAATVEDPWDALVAFLETTAQLQGRGGVPAAIARPADRRLAPLSGAAARCAAARGRHSPARAADHLRGDRARAGRRPLTVRQRRRVRLSR